MRGLSRRITIRGEVVGVFVLLTLLLVSLFFYAVQQCLVLNPESQKVFQQIYLWSLLVALALSTLVGLAVSKKILTPFNQLLHAFRAMQTGDLKIRLESPYADERAELAEGFNKMAASLQSARHSKALRMRELSESREQLENTKRDLIGALESVQKADQTKNDFVANMSHELRTPLNAIIGMTELVLDSKLDLEQREFLKIVHSSSQSLLQIINDLLDFGSIERGQVLIETGPASVRRIVKDVTTLFAEECSKKNVTLIAEVDSQVPDLVKLDEARVRQIISNLVSNALKFSQKNSGVSLSVGARGLADQKVRLAFKVADTGVGIDKEKIAVIFDPFTQGDLSRTRKFGGTGLGLAISRSLAEQMGGQLHVQSESGKGSQFTLELVAEVLATQIIEVPAAPNINFVENREIQVLLVEDNEVNQKLAQVLLENMGLEVSLAKDGLEAVQCCNGSQFDLIFMDVQMPRLNGLSATEKIREQSELNKSTPIIALTAHAMTGDRERFLKVGMNDYVSKPFDKNELKRAVSRALRIGEETLKSGLIRRSSSELLD